MKNSNSKSIRTKLKLVIISTCIITIILASTALFTYQKYSFRKTLVGDLKTKALMISENINASLIFRDSTDAFSVLSSLKSQTNIIAAAVYDENNDLFVSYIRSKDEFQIPKEPLSERWFEEEDALVLYKPIVFDDIIGTIYLRSDLESEKEQTWSLLQIMFLVLLGSSAVGYFIAVILEKNISTPILNLADTIRHVSENKDYSVRVLKISDDETGYLADLFNQLISQIQTQDANLRQSNKKMAEEISVRKHTEEVLKESEKRFRNLFKNHPLPMWVYDLDTLLFLEVNEAAVEKYGYSSEEFYSLKITEIRPLEDVKQLLENLKHLRKAHEHSGPWVHKLKDGTLIDVEIYSHTTVFADHHAILVVAIDITNRLKVEKELINSEERYRTTLDNLMEGCQIIGFDFHYLYLNEVAAVQTRYPKEKLLGKTMMEVHPGFENTEIFAEIKRCMTERASHRMKSEFVYPDGSSGWYDIDIEPVPEGVFIISTDITKEKQLNDELEKYQSHLETLVNERTIQLESVNKELESFSYSVSHDLRAPLRHIDGFAELLKKSTQDKIDSKATHFLEMISDSAKQMGILIDELLVFSRMGRIEMNKKLVKVNTVIEDVIFKLSPDIEGRNIEWKIDDLPEAEVDPFMLKLVYQNLIGNAIKYTRSCDPAIIHIGAEERDEEIIFFIKDNGAGFDMKYADKLFGVFQRLHTTEEFEGTGIGLANVQRIVMRHGGTAWAKGEVNKGAKIYFSMPKKNV